MNSPGLSLLTRIENILLGAGALAVMALGILVAGNVVMRAVFDYSLPDSVVIARELMVAGIILPVSAVTAARSHVAVDFVANRLPERMQLWLMAFGSLIGLLTVIVFFYSGWRELSSTWISGAFFFGDLSLPKWPGRFLFVVGVGVCTIRLVQLLFKDAFAAVHGESISDSDSKLP